MLPGVYQIQANAALFLPATRKQLHLAAGAKPRVDLILTGLLDDTRWLPIGRPASDEHVDDWKWTLRSPSNRPMLRVLSDQDAGGLGFDSGSSKAASLHGYVQVDAGSANFGISRRQITASAGRNARGDSSRTLVGMAVGETEGAREGSRTLFASSESKEGLAGVRRVTGSVRSLPQIRTGANTDGLAVASVASGERLGFGEFATLECGSELDLVRGGGNLVSQHPFAKVSSSGLGLWTLSYAMATSPIFADYDSLGAISDVVPTAIFSQSKMTTESGLHQELRVTRTLHRARVEVAYHHDLQHRSVATGMFTTRPRDGSAAVLTNVSLDEDSGVFRSLGPGFRSDGYRVQLDLPFTGEAGFSAAYVSGGGLGVEDGAGLLTSKVSSRHSQALILVGQGRLSKTGTRIITTYRWQPASMVSIVSPYDLASVKPYLSVHVRQRVSGHSGEHGATELTIDGSNLLGQGYNSVSQTGEDAILASAFRELRVGLNLTF